MMHLWAILIGAAALGVPVLVHYLTKARPVKMPLSTIRFVREAVQQKRARHRLRDILVLACRIAAIALIALAFARPMLGARKTAVVEDAGTIERIIIVDVSQSLAASSQGATLFELARAKAANYIRYEPGLRANLILAGARPRPIFERASPNLSGLSDEMGRMAPTSERLNLNAAITLAGEMLQRGQAREHVKREVVIVSDFQRTNWSSVSFEPLPKDTGIQLDSVLTKDRVLDNLAIMAAAFPGRIAQGQEARLEVEVANFSPSPRRIQVQVTLEGRTYPLEQECAAGGRARVTTPVVFSAQGWHVGDVRLLDADDALAADNIRPIAVRVLPAPSYVLVTRQSPEPRPVSSHFLQRALVPSGKSSEKVTRITASQIDRESIASPDVIVLDHPGKIDAAAINLLASSMRRGKSILYVACEPVDAGNLRLLADAAGTDLRMPVEFKPAGAARSSLSLGELRKNDPVFAVFGEQLQATIDAFRFGTLLTSERTKDGIADDIVASYADRSACLVVTDCAGGTLAVLNADLGTSNVATSGAFVAMIGELTGRMLSRRSSPPAALAGESSALALGGDVGNPQELQIVGSNGKPPANPGQIVDEQGQAVWRWSAAPAAGSYRVMRGNVIVGAIASTVPPEESDLSPIEQSVIKDRLAGGRDIQFIDVDTENRREDHAWVWLAMAAAGCMMVEVLVLRVFRS